MCSQPHRMLESTVCRTSPAAGLMKHAAAAEGAGSRLRSFDERRWWRIPAAAADRGLPGRLLRIRRYTL